MALQHQGLAWQAHVDNNMLILAIYLEIYMPSMPMVPRNGQNTE
jgi:hypothetical protein